MLTVRPPLTTARDLALDEAVALENFDDLFPVLLVGGFFLGEDDHALVVFEALQEHFDFVADLEFVDVLELGRGDDALGFVADIDQHFARPDFQDVAFYDTALFEIAKRLRDQLLHFNHKTLSQRSPRVAILFPAFHRVSRGRRTCCGERGSVNLADGSLEASAVFAEVRSLTGGPARVLQRGPRGGYPAGDARFLPFCLATDLVRTFRRMPGACRRSRHCGRNPVKGADHRARRGDGGCATRPARGQTG